MNQSLAVAYAVKKAAHKKKMAMGGEANLKEEYSEPEHVDHVNEKLHPHHMPGMHPHHVAMAIMNAKKMADGGLVGPKKPKEDKIAPHDDKTALGYSPDDEKVKKMQQAFGMAEGGMVEDPDFLSDEEDDSGIFSMEEPEEDPIMKRKSMLDGIMRGISSKHYGK